MSGKRAFSIFRQASQEITGGGLWIADPGPNDLSTVSIQVWRAFVDLGEAVPHRCLSRKTPARGTSSLCVQPATRRLRAKHSLDRVALDGYTVRGGAATANQHRHVGDIDARVRRPANDVPLNDDILKAAELDPPGDVLDEIVFDARSRPDPSRIAVDG
jgi:hypothetical protein